MKVAIQDELGSFTHEAVRIMLPRARVVPCMRSAEVFDKVEKGLVQAAVIPIENSLAGSVAEHFDLSKIESRLMRGHPWEYVFFVDILCGDDGAARNALRHLAEIAEFVKVLGIYPAASSSSI